MSADGASSTEGATVFVHEPPPVHATVTIRDEFEGPITLNYTLSEEDAQKVSRLGESVARLYFGHELGPMLQAALKRSLEAPLEP